MLHISEAKQFGSGELSPYSKVPWKDLSQKVGELGYQRVSQVRISDHSSLHVLSRQDYSPPSFLPRKEPVQLSSVVMVQVYGKVGADNVHHISITRPGINLSIEELTHDADVMGKYFIDRTKPFETRLLRNPWAILGAYVGVGLATGVGVGELLYSTLPEGSRGPRYFMDSAFGFVFAFGVPMARVLFENGARFPALRMKAVSQFNVSSYMFGHEVVNSIYNESRAQQFELAASLVHAELTKSGVPVDEETFYRAFTIVKNLGVDKTEEVAAVTKVPLERIVEIVRAHPGILPAPALSR